MCLNNTPNDLPKSADSRCVIEHFGGVLSLCLFWIFRYCWGFCHRTDSGLFPFLSMLRLVSFKLAISLVFEFWLSLFACILHRNFMLSEPLLVCLLIIFEQPNVLTCTLICKESLMILLFCREKKLSIFDKEYFFEAAIQRVSPLFCTRTYHYVLAYWF